MKAENLIALAAARGVDLLQAARSSAKPTRSNGGLVRKFIDGKMELVPRTPTARGSADHSTLRPTWTLQELAIASASVPDIPFMAACYAFAGDRSRFTKLQNALADRARRMQREQGWPLSVIDHHGIKRPYLDHLAKLVLDEDAHPVFFAAYPPLYALYMGVTEQTWDKGLECRFIALKAVWGEWLGTACGIIQAKLRDPDSVAHA